MNIANHLPVLAIVVPLMSAVLVPVAGRVGRYSAWLVTVAACAVSFLISASLLGSVLSGGRISYMLGGWAPPWGIEYAVDYLSGFVLVIVSAIALMVSVYSWRSVNRELPEERITFFYCVYMLLVTGLMGIVITGDIFNLYVFVEISSLAGYTLIATGRKREALTASFNYLIIGTIAATFMLLGIGHLYMVTGTLNMADLGQRLPALYDSRVVRTAFAFFTVGLSIKVALFPLHIWLPNAYANAPSPVGAILAATGTKVGAYALLRVMFTVFDLEFDLRVVPFTKILLVVSSVAIVAGSVLAVAQTNLRRMLAYSSVGQVGYIVLGAAVAAETAMAGSIVHILNHALMKGTLFMVAGVVLFATGKEDIADLRGLGRKMPVTMAAFTVAALSMIGVPLTVGFVSKWYIAVGAVEVGLWYLVPVILISSLLTAVYFWRVIEGIYFGKAQEAVAVEAAPPGILLPTAVMAGLCVFFGIFASAPLNIALKAAAMLLGTS
jgi:multicomponent Na+:H+ antiporter subunit D